MQSWIKAALSGALAAAAGMVATPATATDFSMTFKGSDNVTGTTKYRDFTLTTGSESVNLRVSGWSIIGSTISSAYVGRYAQGLGITNKDENGQNSTHVIDNSVQKDFVLLQFSAPVLLTSLTTAAFSIAGSTDSDASIGWGKTANAWNNTVNASGDSSTVLNSLLTTTPVEVKDTAGAPKMLSVGSASNLWLVAASLTNTDRAIDGFKLTGITVSTAPEPGTWMMMILGFGAIGYSVRRRRTGASAIA